MLRKSIILITFLIILSACTQNLRQPYLIEKIEYPNLDSLDQSLINKLQIHSMLSRSYFSGNTVDGFSSANLVTQDVDIYRLRWIVSLMSELNYRTDYFENIRNNLFADIEKKVNYESLSDIDLLCNIMKEININDDSINMKIHNALQRKFLSNENMFYSSSLNEDLSTKIIATSLAIDILEITNPQSDILKRIKNKFITLFEDDNNFEMGSDISKNIINNEGLIIQSLYLMGLKSNDLLKNRTNWITYWNKHLEDFQHDDIYGVTVLNSLIEINNFFGTTYKINSQLINKIQKNTNFLKQNYITEDGFIYEPQHVFFLYKILNDSNSSSSFISQFHNVVDSAINERFVRTTTPVMKTYDNFYGIVLSDISGFPYNKDKVMLLTQNLYKDLIISKDKILTRQDFISTFYLIQIYNYYKIPIPETDEIIKRVDNYLLKLNYSDLNAFQSNIKDLNIGLELIHFLKGNVSSLLKDETLQFINKINKNSELQPVFSSIYVTDVYKILFYLDETKNHPNLVIKINDTINKLYYEHGYRAKTNGDLPDILSTFKVFEVLNLMKKINSNQINSLALFLQNSIDKNGEIHLSSGNDFTDLRVYYCAYNLLKIIKN
jgi:hypothetical protein